MRRCSQRRRMNETDRQDLAQKCIIPLIESGTFKFYKSIRVATVSVGLTKQFLDSYFKLAKPLQKKAMDSLEMFGNDTRTSGDNLEKLRNSASKNTYSIRVDQAYRIILGKSPADDIFVALHVAHHDAAYKWAESHKFEANASTGVLQLFKAVDAIHSPQPDRQPSTSSETTESLFKQLSKKQFLQLGAPSEWIEKLSSITDFNDFETYRNIIPSDVFEALDLIANGEPFEDVLNLLAFEPTAETSNELISADSFSSDICIVNSPRELREVLEKPLSYWRIFLHPSQKQMVETNWNGPVRISGGPGTGKTVCAVHRVAQLLQREQTSSIFVTSFDRFLTSDMRSLLEELCGSKLPDTVKTLAFYQWVGLQLKKLSISKNVIEHDTSIYRSTWSKVMAGKHIEFSIEFIADEFESVILENSITTLAEYIRFKRIGRGTRLTSDQRIAIFDVFVEFKNELKKLGEITYQEACDLVRNEILSGNNLIDTFDHVVVDEVQDLSAPALRLIATMTPGQLKPSVFMVGDLNQRIRSLPANFSKCGLDIRGRSRHLKVNYRTPKDIYKFALKVNPGVGDEYIEKTSSIITGSAPSINKFETIDEETNALKSWVLEKRKELPDEEICVITRTTDQLKAVREALRDSEINCYEIRGNIIDKTRVSGVRISYIHRIKGLEFSAVAIVGANKNSLPYDRGILSFADEERREDYKTRERNAFFVALTRTRKFLWLSGAPELTEFIPDK